MAIQVSKKIIRFGVIASALLLVFLYFHNQQTGREMIPDFLNIPSSISNSLSPTLGDKFDYKIMRGNKAIWKNYESEDTKPKGKAKACFVSLARNRDAESLAESVRLVEKRFNHKYNYPWVFLNDEPFSEEFKTILKDAVSGKAIFDVIPKEQWSIPSWIDEDKAAYNRQRMEDDNIIYGGSLPYRHMCRFESGFFWRHPALKDYDWYWRVEPETKLYCDVDYDVFEWMQENDKVYGFTISILEYKSTIETLWESTKEFVEGHPEYVAPDNMLDFISEDGGRTYNLCHFWSNFEIASLNFWRSKAYTDYFEFLDKKGGFFYERWGDAPVHSIAAALFLPKDKVHFFNDIGYFHAPFGHCPIEDNIFNKGNCDCTQDHDFTFQSYSCGKQYYEANNMEKPANWERFREP